MSHIQQPNLQSRTHSKCLEQKGKMIFKILGVKMNISTNFKPPLTHGISL